jgi:glycosyltransferase involved in cell wall biosynthesis
MASLSVCLICRDEAANLPAWLKAVAPVADEIVAVDSGSTDASVALLQAAGARVEFRSWSGYADQRNHAAGLATGDWILFLDADERPDEALRQALTRLKQGPAPAENAFELAYKVFFFGRFLKHGGYFGERHLRLYRRGAALWDKREVHERLVCDGPVGLLGGFVEHYSYATVGDYLTRLDRYSAEAARQMHAAGRTATGFTAWSHAAWAFLNRYAMRLGFLDGWEGYLAARLEALYTLTKYARLRELSGGRGDRRP